MIHVITSAWNPATVTWNTKPTAQTTALSTISITSNLKIWFSFNVTSVVKNMLAGSLVNNGFMIGIEDNSGVEVICTSSKGTTAMNRPKLTLYYSKTAVLNANAPERKQNPVSIVRSGNRLTVYNPHAGAATLQLFTMQGRSVSPEMVVQSGAKIPVLCPNGAFIAKAKRSSSFQAQTIVIVE